MDVFRGGGERCAVMAFAAVAGCVFGVYTFADAVSAKYAEVADEA